MAVGFVISEVLFLPDGGDAQWIELYNGTGGDINLGDFSIGWGRNHYLHGTPVDLDNVTLAKGQTYLIGGPYYGPLNGFDPSGPNPYDQVHDFEADLRKGNKKDADGVALFKMDAIDIVPSSVPYFTVIYGKENKQSKLLGADGQLAWPDAISGGWVDGESLEILSDGTWVIATTPNPGVMVNPEPGTGVLLAVGLIALAISRQR
jgi:hypothetical protein